MPPASRKLGPPRLEPGPPPGLESNGALAVAEGYPELIRPPVGSFYTWWRGDPLTPLPPLAGLEVGVPADPALATRFGLDPAEVAARLAGGHRIYVARLDGRPVAYGWVATAEATIGELGLRFSLPPANRYLWDFFTGSAWRGLGIYPRLLQAILGREEDAERFWVGHDTPNVASRRGILKAGFQEVGQVYRTVGAGLVLVPVGPLDRAVAAARLLGLSLVAGPTPV